MKPPVPYYGGKQRIANRIAATFPRHDHYVEPFAGGLSVLLAKPPSPMETVNDLDGALMLFWRVLRDRPHDLARACALTPHSRQEFNSAITRLHSTAQCCTDGCGGCEIERARLVWTQLAQSRTCTRRNVGWRFHEKPSGSSMGMPGYLAAYVRRMETASERLRHVSLECRPALEVIRAYGEHEDVLIYADPPYPASTRTGGGYAHEMLADSDHGEMLAALLECRAKVVVGGYAHPLYEDRLHGWRRVEIAAWTGQSPTRADGARTEVLWANRDPALERQAMLL